MDENQRHRTEAAESADTQLPKPIGRLYNHDLVELHRYWHAFLQLRDCPHCGHDHWHAKFNFGGPRVISRWVYQCQGCFRLWGNCQSNWPYIQPRMRKMWGLDLNNLGHFESLADSDGTVT